jgi:Ca2+/Na+ antiporter
MNFLSSIILFFIFYAIFDWIIKKTNIHNRLFNQPQKSRYTRAILVVLLLIFTFLLENARSFFQEKYGQYSYTNNVAGALLGSIYINFAPLIFRKNKMLRKDDLKGIAKLMYQDVSDDSWDKENLTKKNLDYTIGSIRYIDTYAQRLMNTEKGIELLNKHYDHFVLRIGAYIGEVIKRNSKQDFDWYEFDSVYNYSKNPDLKHNEKKQSVLYSKQKDIVMFPLLVVSQHLEGKSLFPNLQTYVQEMIMKNS